MKLIPVLILVILGFSNQSKTLHFISSDQDTTTIEYWKKRARIEEAQARRAMLEGLMQRKLAEENAKRAVGEATACKEAVDKLKKTIEEQSKTIEECKKRN